MAQQVTSRRRSKTLNARNYGRHLLITKNREIHAVFTDNKNSDKNELKRLVNWVENKLDVVIEA